MNELVLPGDALASPTKDLTVVANTKVVTVTQRFPDNLPDELNLVLGQTGNAYAVLTDVGNPYVLAVGSNQLNNLIREKAKLAGHNLRQTDIRDINHLLLAYAESSGNCREVWYRVAPVTDGIEIDVGDEQQTRIRITAGQFQIVKEGSTNLFFRAPSTLPMVMPSGDAA